MGTSSFMVTHWVGLLIATLAISLGSAIFFHSARGRLAADWLRLHAPVLGNLYRQACLTRALRTLGSMITAGVSMLEAVLITRDVVGNQVFGRILVDAHRRLQHGDQLSHALLGAPYVPRPVWQMLQAGERTGNLGPAMDRICDLCEADLKRTIHTMTQFIEPLMIVVVGTIVGGIALAMLLPIFQISRIMAS
jgi:type IV pilus assembly protein PilC